MFGKTRAAVTFVLVMVFCGSALPQQNREVRSSASNQSKGRNGMVRISAAVFEMGTDNAKVPGLLQKYGVKRSEIFSSETPRHRVKMASFYIDKYEVTNAEFQEFVLGHPQWQKDKIPATLHNGKYLSQWNGNAIPPDKGNFPVVFVSWYAAVAYCQAQGKRLPTEAEWEYAARGGLRGKEFPWGDDTADKTRANYSATGLGAATAVGSYPANGYGLFDMAGNVWEYMADEWADYPANRSLLINPIAGGDHFTSDSYLKVTSRRVIRGGSWGGSAINLRITYRDSHPVTGAGDHVGFRCVMPRK